MASYRSFAAAIAVSTLAIFCVMYLNSYTIDHVEFSQMRTWMAVLMGTVVAAVLLVFGWAQYGNRRLNAAILVGAAVVFAGALALVRSQETVGDVAYLEAMIPQHSVSLMMSENAHVHDPEVQVFAREMAARNRADIARMKALIASVEAKRAAAD